MAATIASNSQEWIASQLSATAAGARPPRTRWNYVRDRNGMMLIDPVTGFYFNPPPNAKCRWSTENGARAPQQLTMGLLLPRRDLILWDDQRLESEAAYFREKYWDEMRTLVAPQQFEDLYEYFDSATLFTSGAVNLWNLINLLANDARHNWREVEKQASSVCNDWVLDWLEALPNAEHNRQSLIKWDNKSDILTAVTSQFDWDNDLKALDLVGQNILRECFLFHFERLTGKKPNVARFYIHAAGSKPISARKPVMASAVTPAQDSPSPNEVPLPPSPAQTLCTIQEESAAIKAATKPEGLTIDTTASAQIPLQTVSAPATAVPRIAVEPQPAKEADDMPEKHDRRDKTEDECLTNQALADRVQTTVRQLSSQSTPGERQGSTMLNAPTNEVPPRAVSATEPAGVLQHPGPQQHTFPEKAGTIPRNMYGNKPPFRGPPKSPQGYGPNCRQIPANMLGFSGERSFPQQRPSFGLSQQQHMMQAFGPPSNGMQQPLLGFIPPTTNQGMPSKPDALPPQVQGFPPAVGMKPLLGLPGMDFQNQVPMGPPHMDQPQSIHPQAPPVGMPPQYMGQQDIDAPVYQSNGYVPQSQRQPGRDKGNKWRHEDRRDSMNSTGSRSKVRDDPIHGPVYTLKPQKDSNTPTGRQLPNSDGCVPVDPKQKIVNPNFACRNNQWGAKLKGSYENFVECPCIRCVKASRSLFVKHGKLPVERIQTVLMNYLGGWGAVQVIVHYDECSSMVVFKSDHDAIRALQDLCTRPNQGKDIPGLGRVIQIWYAWYSKHFTSPRGNPEGLPRGLLEAKRGRRRSSSTLRRDSNSYRNQLPNNISFNPPSFTNYGPGPQAPHIWHDDISSSFSHNMVPVYQQLPQRGLWEPDSAGQNRKPSKTESRPKDGMAYQPKTYPKRPDASTALKEDWRSKPPAEEIIEDISSDEAAVADTSSNVSSQGARDIKICLPNEAGSSRSRSISPEIEESPSEKQVRKEPLEPRDSAVQEVDQAERGAVQDLGEEAVVEDDGPISSGYRKGTAELAVPVEEFQPTVAVEQVHPTESHVKKGLTSYSKVTSELTEATETFDMNTVIRHKSPRSPLPKEWMAASEQEPSNLQDRFGALSGALQLEALGQRGDALVAEGATVAETLDAPKAEEASTQQAKQKNKYNKNGKARRNKSQASNATSASTSSSVTPTEAQSRGQSRTSNNRPMSQLSNSRPEPGAGITTQPATGSQSATLMEPPDVADTKQPTTKKKNTKAKRKNKQKSTVESLAASSGQTKTEGPQDQGQSVSVKKSPTKKPKTQHSGPATKTQNQSKPVKPEDGTQSKSVVEKHDESRESSSQNDAGGSLSTKKDRSPQNPPQKSDCSDEKEPPQKQGPTGLQDVFELPADTDNNHCSPEANLFPNQKFTIDKVKRDSAMATPPTTQQSDVRHRQPSAMSFPTHDARIALPLLPPNSKPTAWASVAARAARSKSDDPFASVKGQPQSEDWLRDKAVKTPQKPSSEPTSHQTSPTPSPEKKKNHQGGRSRLNAAAKTFEPSSIPPSPTPSVVSVLSAKAVPFHMKKPSLPGQKGPVEQRLVTPAEQVVDPTTVTQPGPPTKEKKRVGPAPDRGGNDGQKERAKSSNTATSTKTAAQVASAAESKAPKLIDDKEFPTLAAAAAVPQRRASSAIKASTSAAVAISRGVTTVAPKAAAAPKPPVTSPNNNKLGQRGDAPAQAAEKQGAGDKSKAGGDQWTTVGSSKKGGGKKNGSNNNGRTASARSGGGATGQGGRAGGQGTRGGRASVGEERKGG